MNANTSFNSITRYFFLFGVIPLLFIAGVQLFVLSEQTDAYFAWTIPLPLTAAFMGAGYWAALAHAFVIVRNPNLERTRVSIPAALTATTLLLVATLLHLDQFHLNNPAFITRFVTWVWIIVYLVTPPIFLYFFVTQIIRGNETDSKQYRFPDWVRGGFYLMAAFGLITGIELFFFPDSMIPIWPWPLAPLASRAIGVWMATFGVAAATLAWQNNRVDGRGTLASLLAFCTLQLVVLLRYPESVDFANPLAWGYFLFLLLGMAASGAGLFNRR